jgi:hypothetical protein
MKHRKRQVAKICPECKSYNTIVCGGEQLAKDVFTRILYICQDCDTVYHIVNGQKCYFSYYYINE